MRSYLVYHTLNILFGVVILIKQLYFNRMWLGLVPIMVLSLFVLKIGLHAQNLITILGLKVNIMGKTYTTI
jgi:hypothetical protein